MRTKTAHWKIKDYTPKRMQMWINDKTTCVNASCLLLHAHNNTQWLTDRWLLWWLNILAKTATQYTMNVCTFYGVPYCERVVAVLNTLNVQLTRLDMMLTSKYRIHELKSVFLKKKISHSSFSKRVFSSKVEMNFLGPLNPHERGCLNGMLLSIECIIDISIEKRLWNQFIGSH